MFIFMALLWFHRTANLKLQCLVVVGNHQLSWHYELLGSFGWNRFMDGSWFLDIHTKVSQSVPLSNFNFEILNFKLLGPTSYWNEIYSTNVSQSRNVIQISRCYMYCPAIVCSHTLVLNKSKHNIPNHVFSLICNLQADLAHKAVENSIKGMCIRASRNQFRNETQNGSYSNTAWACCRIKCQERGSQWSS